MTERQKAEALKLRAKGRSYKEIGEQIGTTTESVKQFFYRNRQHEHKPLVQCEQCHQMMAYNESRQQRFCSDLCRTRWWSHHPEEYSNKDEHCFCCNTCKKLFYSRRATASFCSRSCYYQSRRKEPAVHGVL